MDCSFIVNNDFGTIAACTLQNTGISFEIAALIIILMYVVFALMARLDFDMSLGLGSVLAWVLLYMSGGSYVLQVLFYLLIAGVALRVFIALIGIFRQ